MGTFGWSYPPGCPGPPEYDEPCQICGLSGNECICPECPVCLAVGDPYCYDHHGLVRTEEQIESLKKQEEKWEQDSKVEHDYISSDEGE